MNSGHSLNDVQIPSSNCWLLPAGLLHPLGVGKEFPSGSFSSSRPGVQCGAGRDPGLRRCMGQGDVSSALSGNTCAAILGGSETISYGPCAANKS